MNGFITDASTPVLSGPFGTLAAGAEVPLGFNHLFAALPATAAALLQTVSDEIIEAAISCGCGSCGADHR